MAHLCDRLSGEESIICGDLNCPGTESTLVDHRLSEVIRDHGLFQFVKGTTRRFGTKDLGGNVLNVVIGRQNSLIQDGIKITEVGYSHHNLVSFHLATPTTKPAVCSHTYRDLKNFDNHKFQKILLTTSSVNNPSMDVNEYLSQLKANVVSALDQVAPWKSSTNRVSPRSSAVWMNEEAKSAKRMSRKA